MVQICSHACPLSPTPRIIEIVEGKDMQGYVAWCTLLFGGWDGQWLAWQWLAEMSDSGGAIAEERRGERDDHGMDSYK